MRLRVGAPEGPNSLVGLRSRENERYLIVEPDFFDEGPEAGMWRSSAVHEHAEPRFGIENVGSEIEQGSDGVRLKENDVWIHGQYNKICGKGRKDLREIRKLSAHIRSRHPALQFKEEMRRPPLRTIADHGRGGLSRSQWSTTFGE